MQVGLGDDARLAPQHPARVGWVRPFGMTWVVDAFVDATCTQTTVMRECVLEVAKAISTPIGRSRSRDMEISDVICIFVWVSWVDIQRGL